jgi:DNA-binding GntR family transcriptional regulator
MTEPTTPDRPDLVSRAYGTLRELIVSGKLAPGTRIIETDIAERLGLSRTPLRSALHRLQQEGWVTEQSATGRHLRLSVSTTTEADARELYEIIGSLEGMAARRAAALPIGERTRLADELARLSEEMRLEAARPDPDPQRVFEWHSSFHVGLVGGVGAPRLRTMFAAIKPQSDRYRRVYGSALVPVAAEAAAEQDLVVNAIRAGIAERAEELARTNWANAADRICRIIRDSGERGEW